MICRVCNSNNLELVLDLGEHPWCNNFLTESELGKEPHYPLRLLYCHDCSTSQLDYTVKKEIMFSDHTYLSGTTKTLSDHFKNVAWCVDKTYFKDRSLKSVMDIGSNDGTQLQHFKDLDYDVLGVESSRQIAAWANEKGINTINKYFNLDLAREINRKFNVINAAGVFFHLEELHSVTDGIRESLRDDGVFVVQFLYMKSIQENLAFDQIYHEHLLYYNLKNIEFLLNLHGLSMFDAYLAPVHGGSIVGFVSHRGKQLPTERLQALLAAEEKARSNDFTTYQDFARRVEASKSENLNYLNDWKVKSKTIYGFGAPAKGNTLLNYYGIGPEILDYLVEKNSLRKNRFSPGMHIPIILEADVIRHPDIYYVLAWNFKREILLNNQHLVDQGIEFHFPINPREGN